MKIEDVQRDDKKDIVITIRTTKQNSEWMKKNNISPSMFFDRALLEFQQKLAEEGLSKFATPKKNGNS